MQHAVRSGSEATFPPLARAYRDSGAPRRDEDRRDDRPCERDVRYRLTGLADAGWSHGVTVDVSETGGTFLVDGAWHIVERIEGEDSVPIALELPCIASNDPIRVRGEVVWVQPDGGGSEGVDRIGVRFRDVPLRDAARLRWLICARRDS